MAIELKPFENAALKFILVSRYLTTFLRHLVPASIYLLLSQKIHYVSIVKSAEKLFGRYMVEPASNLGAFLTNRYN